MILLLLQLDYYIKIKIYKDIVLLKVNKRIKTKSKLKCQKQVLKLKMKN